MALTEMFGGVLFLISDVFEMSSFCRETLALLEARKASLEAKNQDTDDEMEDADVIKMAVRFDK